MPRINIQIELHEGLFIKDPLSSPLGKRIIKEAIGLFHAVGYESFNFKLLSKEVGSPEASIYRYFENKYKLLSYLVSWYWDYMHYMVLLDTRNIDNPMQRLEKALHSITFSLHQSEVPEYIDQEILHRVVVAYATKVYHYHQVDRLKEEGFYRNYVKVIERFAEFIIACNASYSFPRALATNLIEMALSSEYYLEHFPELTDHGQRVEGEEARKLAFEAVIHFAQKNLT